MFIFINLDCDIVCFILGFSLNLLYLNRDGASSLNITLVVRQEFRKRLPSRQPERSTWQRFTDG